MDGKLDNQNGVVIDESTEFGGFWIRVGAYLIDCVLLLIPLLLVSFLFRAVTLSPAAGELEKAIVDMMDSILNILVWWVYFAVLNSSEWQGTVGKKVLGLKVVDEHGQRITFGRATGRYFAEILSALALMIGYMMVGWTKRKQGLHDMIASTCVIKV